MLNNQENRELVLIKDLGMAYPTEKSKHKARYGIYKCYCGNEFKTQIRSVKSGNTTSCGCYHKKMVVEANTTHGLTHHRLNNIWDNMKSRCFNKRNKDFKNYGGRGITICKEWKNNFQYFYNWAIENGYKDNLTIDRINTNGNYEPDNCRWTTIDVQNRNTRLLRSTNKSGYRGVCFDNVRKKWRASIQVNNNQIYLGMFDNAIDGANAYNKYVTDNNLDYPINLI